MKTDYYRLLKSSEQRPNSLTKEFQCVDMHFHSHKSDGSSSLAKIAKHCQKRQIGVSIVDHNTHTGSYLFDKNHKNIFSIPGIEIGVKENVHVLLYFYDANELKEYSEKYVIKHHNRNPNSTTSLSLYDLFDSAKQYNCLIAGAHPTIPITSYNIQKKFNEHKLSLKTLKKFDAMETICSAVTRNANRKAIAFQQLLNSSYTAGSDGHILSLLGSSLTYSEADSREEFLKNIRNKTNQIIGRSSKIREKIHAGSQIFARSHLKHPLSTVKNILKL